MPQSDIVTRSRHGYEDLWGACYVVGIEGCPL